MTLEAFQKLLAERLPDAREIAAFSSAQGWRLRLNGDRIRILLTKPDPIAAKLVKLVNREPFLSGLTKLLCGEDRLIEATPEHDSASGTGAVPMEDCGTYVKGVTRYPGLSRAEVVRRVLASVDRNLDKAWWCYDSSSPKMFRPTSRCGIKNDWDRICVEGDEFWTYLPVETLPVETVS